MHKHTSTELHSVYMEGYHEVENTSASTTSHKHAAMFRGRTPLFGAVLKKGGTPEMHQHAHVRL